VWAELFSLTPICLFDEEITIEVLLLGAWNDLMQCTSNMCIYFLFRALYDAFPSPWVKKHWMVSLL
jgi:hypothetical protein